MLKRDPLSRQCRDVIRYVSPRRLAFIQKCRSMPFAIRELRGERIYVEFDLSNDDVTGQRVLYRLKKLSAEMAAISGLISLEYAQRGQSLFLDAIVIWT